MTFMVSWLLAGALLYFIINVTYAHKPISEIKGTVVRRSVVVGSVTIMLPTWTILLAIMYLAAWIDGESVWDIWEQLAEDAHGLMDDIEGAWSGQ